MQMGNPTSQPQLAGGGVQVAQSALPTPATFGEITLTAVAGVAQQLFTAPLSANTVPIFYSLNMQASAAASGAAGPISVLLYAGDTGGFLISPLYKLIGESTAGVPTTLIGPTLSYPAGCYPVSGPLALQIPSQLRLWVVGQAGFTWDNVVTNFVYATQVITP